MFALNQVLAAVLIDSALPDLVPEEKDFLLYRLAGGTLQNMSEITGVKTSELAQEERKIMSRLRGEVPVHLTKKE